MKFRNDIQGLRAIAFLLVFVFHLNSAWLPGGFLGVDVFFVISGFLITTIILDQLEKGKFSFLNFYEKRIKRIVPLYYFVLLFCALAGLIVFHSLGDVSKLRKELLISGTFLSNLIFGKGESYFGTKLSENPMLHTWSLSIEMQFYFILPLVLFSIKKKYLPIFLLASILLITAYSSYQIYIQNKQSIMYFSLLARMPEFLIGSLFATVFSKVSNISRTTSNILAAIGLISLTLCVLFIHERTPFPGFIALIPSVGLGLILISNNSYLSDLLSKKPLVYIGELSYSLYLWHWVVMAFMRFRNDAYQFDIFETVIISALTFGLSLLSYYAIENHFRKLSNKSFILRFIPMILPKYWTTA